MKPIKKYITESLLDDESKLMDSIDDSYHFQKIQTWIDKNCRISKNINIHKVNKEYIVDASEIAMLPNIKSLTNELFKWGDVESFSCEFCVNLRNLKGSPKKCNMFNCVGVKKLISLEGSPEKCDNFFCYGSELITSLEGSPKKCKCFYCNKCSKLESLKGAPKNCKEFYCDNCNNLTSLKGAPEKCKVFCCRHCNSLQSIKDGPYNCTIFNCDRNKFPQEEINTHLK